MTFIQFMQELCSKGYIVSITFAVVKDRIVLSVIPKIDALSKTHNDKDRDYIPPFNISGNVSEIDDNFIDAVTSAFGSIQGVVDSIDFYRKQIKLFEDAEKKKADETAKKGKKSSTSTSSKKEEKKEETKPESPDLFEAGVTGAQEIKKPTVEQIIKDKTAKIIPDEPKVADKPATGETGTIEFDDTPEKPEEKQIIDEDDY